MSWKSETLIDATGKRYAPIYRDMQKSFDTCTHVLTPKHYMMSQTLCFIMVDQQNANLEAYFDFQYV